MGFCFNKLLYIISIILFLALFYSCNNETQRPTSKNIYTLLSAKSDSLTISDILTPEKKSAFKKSKTYKKTNDSILWCLVTIKKEDLSDKANFLVSSDPFLQFGKAFIVKNNAEEVEELHTFIHNKRNAFNFVFYRNPVWELPNNITAGDKIILKLEGHKLRNRVDFFIYDINSFLKTVELEYYWYGLWTTFLILLCVILLVYAFLIKKFAIVYYVLYIISLVFDFYSSRGIGKQFLWFSNDFLMQNRSYSFLLSCTFLSLFFVYFYQYDRKNKIYQNVFKFLGIISILAVISSVINYYITIHSNFAGIAFSSLQLVVFVFLVIHIILAINKQIPKYLAVGFSITFITVIIYQLSIPYVETGSPLISRFLFTNLPYIAFLIEITIMSFFIFDKMIKIQKRYFKLKRLNSSLTNTMTSMTLQAELNERNKLLSTIHDSFGGSIEALKYSLKTDQSSVNVEKVINEFDSRYRLLLKNLDNPQVNANNLENQLQVYVSELEKIFPIHFTSKIDIHNVYINNEKCMHIYLSFCELITNAIKHSKASKIDINFVFSKNELILVITDNGVGFSETAQKGYGLKSIKERTTKLNGNLEIKHNHLGSCIILKLSVHYE